EGTAAQVGLALEVAALQRRHLEVQERERHGGQQLHQRRVLRVEAEVALRERAVGGVDVVALVPPQRLARGRKRELEGQRGQEEDGGEDGPAVRVHRAML